MTSVLVKRSDSGGDFLILDLQIVTKVACRYFEGDGELHQVVAFSSAGGSTALVGEDADRAVSALEDSPATRGPESGSNRACG